MVGCRGGKRSYLTPEDLAVGVLERCFNVRCICALFYLGLLLEEHSFLSSRLVAVEGGDFRACSHGLPGKVVTVSLGVEGRGQWLAGILCTDGMREVGLVCIQPLATGHMWLFTLKLSKS